MRLETLSPGERLFGASAVANDAEVVKATASVVQQLEHALGGKIPKVILTFATAHHAHAYPSLVKQIEESLGAPVIGCSTVSVIGQASEGEGEPGLGALAIGGEALEVQPFSAAGLKKSPAQTGLSLGKLFAELPGIGRWLLMMPDAYVGSLEPFLRPLVNAYGRHPISGGAPSEEGLGRTLQWGADAKAMSGGVSGAFFHGDFEVLTAISQGCSMVGPPLTVTEAVGPVVMALDGKPALEVYTGRLPGPLRAELARAMRTVLLAVKHRGHSEGDYVLARHIIGIEAERQGLVFADPIPEGTEVFLAVRDANNAREDMKRQLQRLKKQVAGRPIAFGVYFNCAGRGTQLYGVHDIDASYIGSELGRFPWIGMASNAELGTTDGETRVYAYTGVLSLVVPR